MATLRPEEVTSALRQELERYRSKVALESVGTVLQVGDGIARVYGLDDAMVGELVEFPGELVGIVLNLEEHHVGVALMGPDHHVKDGDRVKRTGKIAQVPAGRALLGRVVDALAELQQLRRAGLDTPGLAEFLGNPEIDAADKRALLTQTFGPALSAQTLSLVDLLIANGRSQHLPAVAEAFEARWLVSQGVQRVVVQSARPLSPATVQEIRRRVEALINARVEIDAEIEPSLLGGARILVGHREFDGSLRRQLRDLREQWMAAHVD